MANATAKNLREKLWCWQRAFGRALLLAAALAGMTLGTVAHAQIAFRAAAQAGTPGTSTIAFRAAASAAVDSGVLTLTINKPTGTVQGDVMITSIAIRPNTATISLLAGWTLVRRTDNALTTTSSLAVYRKVAGASEPASYSWTLGGAPTGAAGGIQTFSGVDTTTPIDVDNGAATTSSTYTPATPSVTTTVANTMLVTSHGIPNRDLWANPPTWGGTEGFQVRAGVAAIMLQGSWAPQAAAGATLTKTATDLGPDAADNGNAHILALRPASSANLTITKPAGTLQNDVMIASVAVRPHTVTVTPPAGWTLVRRIDNAVSTTNSLLIYRLTAGASEPANYTWTLSAHTGAVGGIASFSGVNTTSPVDVENGQVWTGTANPTAFDVVAPSVTTTVANAMLVTSYALSSSGTSGSAWTPPTGMTEAVDLSTASGGSGESIEVNYAVQVSAGATGTKTATMVGHDDGDAAAHILALRPPALPVFNQSAYRLFNNADSTDVGSALAAQDTAATLGTTGAAFRLRMLLHVTNANLALNGQAFKLQFAARSGTCDTAFTGESYADVTAATAIAYNNNATPADGANLTANASDPTHGADTVVNQDYEELNNFTNTVAAINIGQDGKWDFALRDNGAPASTAYCLRVVTDTAALLGTYTVIPEITTAPTPTPTFDQSAYRLFNNANSTDVGSALAAQDTAATLGATGAAFRLRALLHVANANLPLSGQAFKLQFATRSGTCDTAFSGETYADVTAATAIAYNNNATPADGANLTANAGDPTHGGGAGGIGFDNATSSAAASFSFTIGGGSNRLLVFGGASEFADITNVTFNGVALTFSTLQTGFEARVEFWYMKEAQLPAAGTYTVVVTGAASNNRHGVSSWTGVDQTTPFGTIAVASGTASPITVNVSSAAGEVVHDFAVVKDPGTVTIGGGQAPRWNALSTDIQGMGSTENGAATVTMSWTSTTSVGWATIGVPIKPAAGGAHVVVNQTYEELNNFTNPTAVNIGQDGMWDFALKDNGAAASTAYCFRVVEDTGTLLDTYTVVPEITTAAAGGGVITTVESVSGCAAPVAVAIQFVAAAQAFIAAPTTTLTINKPTGTVQNHVMVASIGFRLLSPGVASTDIGVTPPAGWTLVRRLDNANSTSSGLAVYRKVAGASEPANYAWTFFNNGPTWTSVGWGGAAGGIASFSGVDTTIPVDVENGLPTAAATTTPATPSVTTTVADTMLVTSHAIPNNDLWANPPTSGMTQAFQQTGGSEMVQVSYAPQAAAGATLTKTATDLGPDAADFGNAHILALQPAPTSLTSLTLPSWTPQANELLLVGISMRDEAITHSVSGNGLTWTLVADRDNDRGQMGVALYRASGPSPTAGSVVITLTGNTKPAYAVAVRLSGVDTSAANQGIEAIATASGPAGVDDANMKVTVTTVTPNAWALAWGGQRGSETLTVPAGETIIVQSGADCGTSGDRVRGHMWREIVATPGPTQLGQDNSLSGAQPWAVIGVSIKPSPGGGPLPPGGFNVFETGTAAAAITGVIKTRIAGSTFSLDVVAITSGAKDVAFTDQVSVELLGNNTLGVSLDANNCPTTSTLVQTVSPNPTITTGRSTVNFAAVANSWRDVRARVRWPASSPTVTSCSTDNFAIRPNTLASFAVTDTDWQTAGTGRTLNLLTFAATTPTHKAGQPFSVRATAVNAAGSPATTTNYTGTPTATLTACVGAACTATFGTLTLATTFAAGQLTTDVASYNDVGSFSLQLTDSAFASVDASDGSTSTERNITSAVINVGRFVPDHFAVALNAPAFGTVCAAGNFSYIGQTFSYTTAPLITVTAQGAANNTTTRYDTIGSWFRITGASLTGKAYTAASGTLDTTGLPGTDPVIASSGAGVGTLTFGSGTGIFFTRTTPVAPFDADLSLAINVIDADGVAYASNPARFGTATAGNGIAFNSGKAMRFGRLRLNNASGSSLLDLPLPLTTQYYDGTFFVTNTADSCTTLLGSDLRFGFLGSTPNLVACETAIIPSGTIYFVGGKASSTASPTLTPIKLAKPGSGNDGAVDIGINLNGLSGNRCTAVGAAGPAATNANKPWLRGNWSGGTYTDDPTGRATFGIFKNADKFLYFRELY